MAIDLTAFGRNQKVDVTLEITGGSQSQCRMQMFISES